jgi:hypothetical protein
MNKRVEKPRRKVPLTADADVTEAQLERHLRDNKDVIDALLQEAIDEMERGDFAPLEPLEKLLSDARKYAKRHR